MRSMLSDRERDALESIKRNVEAVRSFIEGFQSANFVSDLRTFYAVTRALEIISEASRRLSDDLKARHPKIPWRAIRDAGNVDRHTYDEVAATLVWDTARAQLDGLYTAAVQELDLSGSGQPRDENSS